MTSKISRVLSDHRKPSDRIPSPLVHRRTRRVLVHRLGCPGRDGDARCRAECHRRRARRHGPDLRVLPDVQGGAERPAVPLPEPTARRRSCCCMENFWKEGSFSDVFKITIGKDYKEFDEEWLYALKKQYYPLLQPCTTQPSMVTQNVVREGFNSKPVVFEHDSTRDVYFIGNRTGYTGIYRRNLDEQRSHWTPGKIVIQGEQIGRTRGIPSVLRKDRHLKTACSPLSPRAAKTTRCICTTSDSARSCSTFRFKSIVAHRLRLLGPGRRAARFHRRSTWGGTTTCTSSTPKTERFSGSRTTTTTTAILPGRPRGMSSPSAPTAHPPGGNGTYNLFLYNLSTGTIDYLTYGNGSAGSPAWSKDGSRIAFTSRSGRGAEHLGDGHDNRRCHGGMRVDDPGDRISPPRHLIRPGHPSGDLVFDVFEKLSFQIKMIRNVAGASLTPPGRCGWSTCTTRRNRGRRAASRGSRNWSGSDTTANTASMSRKASSPPTRSSARPEARSLALSDLLGNEQYYFLLYNTRGDTG